MYPSLAQEKKFSFVREQFTSKLMGGSDTPSLVQKKTTGDEKCVHPSFLREWEHLCLVVEDGKRMSVYFDQISQCSVTSETEIVLQNVSFKNTV